MEKEKRTAITVQTTIKAPIDKVWNRWTDPAHIVNWYFASDDWHSPFSENDLRTNGRFKTRMEAKDGSMGFDFEGLYTEVREHEQIDYEIPDGRRVSVKFNWNGTETFITEIFDAEETHPPEMQKAGWQAILDNFRKYTENS
jgi:uncharacterized protein YndB with AHSA1/START domain